MAVADFSTADISLQLIFLLWVSFHRRRRRMGSSEHEKRSFSLVFLLLRKEMMWKEKMGSNFQNKFLNLFSIESAVFLLHLVFVSYFYHSRETRLIILSEIMTVKRWCRVDVYSHTLQIVDTYQVKLTKILKLSFNLILQIYSSSIFFVHIVIVSRERERMIYC